MCGQHTKIGNVVEGLVVGWGAPPDSDQTRTQADEIRFWEKSVILMLGICVHYNSGLSRWISKPRSLGWSTIAIPLQKMLQDPDAIKSSPRMLGICARYGSRLGRWISKSRTVECPGVTHSLQKCVFEEFWFRNFRKNVPVQGVVTWITGRVTLWIYWKLGFCVRGWFGVSGASWVIDIESRSRGHRGSRLPVRIYFGDSGHVLSVIVDTFGLESNWCAPAYL